MAAKTRIIYFTVVLVELYLWVRGVRGGRDGVRGLEVKGEMGFGKERMEMELDNITNHSYEFNKVL